MVWVGGRGAGEDRCCPAGAGALREIVATGPDEGVVVEVLAAGVEVRVEFAHCGGSLVFSVGASGLVCGICGLRFFLALFYSAQVYGFGLLCAFFFRGWEEKGEGNSEQAFVVQLEDEDLKVYSRAC